MKYILLIIFLFCVSCTGINKTRRCAKKNNIYCIQSMIQYHSNIDRHLDYEKAKYWADKGTKLNDSWSITRLAYFLEMEGKEIESFILYEKAARMGNSGAMIKLSHAYLDSVRYNQDSAFYWATKALALGNEEYAYGNIAVFYYKGIGTKPDINMALYYYKKGCEKGNTHNWVNCDSVVSILQKRNCDTLDLKYWKEKRDLLVPKRQFR